MTRDTTTRGRLNSRKTAFFTKTLYCVCVCTISRADRVVAGWNWASTRCVCVCVWQKFAHSKQIIHFVRERQVRMLLQNEPARASREWMGEIASPERPSALPEDRNEATNRAAVAAAAASTSGHIRTQQCKQVGSKFSS